MNRPFFAIGVLLAFLAAGLLAVGLSSRPSFPDSVRGGSGAPTPRRTVGGTVYLLAVPDEEEAFAQVSTETGEGEGSFLLPCEQPCYAYGCGLDRGTGLVYAMRPVRPRLQTAEVVVATDPNALQPASSIDCRAHYDRRYDAAVYEIRPTMGDELTQVEKIEFADDPTIRLFFSLSGHPSPSPAFLRLKSARRWRLELLQIAHGTAKQMWLVAIRLGLDDRWDRLVAVVRPKPAAAGPSWADYEAWIASLQPGVAERDTPRAETGIEVDGSWRQMLQIAVSWLNHAAKTLDSMAERLGGGGQAASDDRIGVRNWVDESR